MRFITDFHIHSHCSLATSKELMPEFLDLWARIKGVKVVATGDFTHPGWIKELKEKLQPAEPGLFKLKKEFILKTHPYFIDLPDIEPRFLLSAEISTIFKRNDRVRKVHSVILSPDFKTAEKISHKLIDLGANLKSDGRPIIGMDCKNLLDLSLSVSPDIFFIPAHIWTPWFSVLGSKSGFDSIEECFEDLTKNIYAVETGLSTDAPLNWMCSFLDKYTLISNSDAHSPDKLGRNANIFNTDLSYGAMIAALKTGDADKFLGTIDLFPQEGKYHFDGHRKCNVQWDPIETFKHGSICTKCKKPVTIGVVNRIVELSDRTNIMEKPNRLPFYSIIPLPEILSEIFNVGPGSKKIINEYHALIRKFGPELKILLDIPVNSLVKKGNPILGEAIKRMRERRVYIEEGYDGEYGVIKVFNESEANSLTQGDSLFSNIKFVEPGPKRELINFDLTHYKKTSPQFKTDPKVKIEIDKKNGLNTQQLEAVKHANGPALVLAGPGTGKTKTIVSRINYLLTNNKSKPDEILAITFTNKAAAEIQDRVKKESGVEAAENITIKTFHGLGYSILTEAAINGSAFIIISPEDKVRIVKDITNNDRKTKQLCLKIESLKQNLLTSTQIDDLELKIVFDKYQKYLSDNTLLDFEDLIYLPCLRLMADTKLQAKYQNRFKWILIDEYQDINFNQYQLLKLLSSFLQNIFVVGDPNQAIYGFRGSDVKYIKEFINDYPNAKVYQLRQSYRCSNKILKASNNVIDPMGASEAFEGLHEGVNINIHSSRTEKSEAEFVARTIEQMIGGTSFYSIDRNLASGDQSKHINSLSDFAILYRSKHQTPAIVDALHSHNIPYQISDDNLLIEIEPFKAIVDILSFIKDPNNKFLRDKIENNELLKPLDLDHGFIEMANLPLHEKVNLICQNYFITPLASDDIDKAVNMARMSNNDMKVFLETISLNKKIDLHNINMEKVSLLTLHAAKGLEFKCVFIVGCEEGIIPYTLFEKNKADIKEECRLFYVGLTRAQNFIYLTSSNKRFLFGHEYKLERSRFIDLIERNLLESSKDKTQKHSDKSTQKELF
ncbi:MAG: UvrD-helicase domain-containing protein [Candidatus Omnitrophica bacterium]|nr:UvrD-helicase domain-containing protein [Candidatus Omnitrophota bacterium]